MAIDRNRLTALIDELTLPQANKDYLIQTLTDPANEASAQVFISQRVRHDDYTRRTQELATERTGLEQRLNTETARFAQELQQADEKIRRIMDDLSNERISRATADARLQRVKEVYNLDDKDIPNVDPPTRTQNQPPAQQGLTEDAVTRMLTKFRTDLINELKPEFEAFPKVAALIGDIDRRHLDLTGKPLTYAEKQELIKAGQAPNGPTLERAWRDKYEIDKIEKDREREEWSKQDRQKWDDEQKKKNSELAAVGVNRLVGDQRATVSPVLGRKFNEHTESADRFASSSDNNRTSTSNNQPAADVGGPKATGAERAAQRFLERRAAGVPMGAPDPVGAGK